MSTIIETGLVSALTAAAVLTLARVRRGAAPPATLPREAGVLRALATTLDVEPQRLRADAALARDLGLRSADLPRLAAALEAECGLIVPEGVLRGARTVGALVDAVLALDDEDEPAPFVAARLVADAAAEDATDVRYVGWLTPATARSLAQRACDAGPGAALDVHVLVHADDDALGWISDQFGWLRERGIRVGVGVGGVLPA